MRENILSYGKPFIAKIHTETGKFPLCGKVKSLQLKFWLFVKNKYVVDPPESALAKVVKMGLECNSKYLKHCTNLKEEYKSPIACKETIDEKYLDQYKSKMITQHKQDPDSKLGTYYRVNPTLRKNVQKPQPNMEFERELITRFPTGSHSLAVEIGRYSNITRENRLCACGKRSANGVQMLWLSVAKPGILSKRTIMICGRYLMMLTLILRYLR